MSSRATQDATRYKYTLLYSCCDPSRCVGCSQAGTRLPPTRRQRKSYRPEVGRHSQYKTRPRHRSTFGTARFGKRTEIPSWYSSIIVYDGEVLASAGSISARRQEQKQQDSRYSYVGFPTRKPPENATAALLIYDSANTDRSNTHCSQRNTTVSALRDVITPCCFCRTFSSSISPLSLPLET